MSSRILIVEDEPALAAILDAALEFGGFDRECVATGREALRRISAGGIDAVLLDLGLPDVDGRALLKSLREFSDVPILICSGRASEQDKVEALDLGADDFIAKPFLPAEMLARIRAVLRRRSGAASEEPQSGSRDVDLGPEGLTLDPNFQSARFEDREIALSENEYRIAHLLLRERHGPVSRPAIVAALYGEGEERQTKIVEVHLTRLRRKLEELTGRRDMIQNFRGRGWALRGDG